MRQARALREAAGDDCAALTRQMHEQRAAKEDAERELGATVAMYDQVRGDWQKKLKDRRKEVRAGWGADREGTVWLPVLAAQLPCCCRTSAHTLPAACPALPRPRPQVRELERRQAEDARGKEQQAALAAERARVEAERAAKSKCARVQLWPALRCSQGAASSLPACHPHPSCRRLPACTPRT